MEGSMASGTEVIIETGNHDSGIILHQDLNKIRVRWLREYLRRGVLGPEGLILAIFVLYFLSVI